MALSGAQRMWWRLRPRREAGVRTENVSPPSRGDEAGWVLIAAGCIVLAVIYTYAFEREAVRGASATSRGGSGLLPYQVLFRDLPSAEQRAFRAMQEGAGEAVRLRGEDGKWSSPEQLGGAGVPPFARDPLDKAQVRWSGQVDGLFANYVGVPSAPGEMPMLLILVQEPDPVTGEKPLPPSVVDEEHQVLADGTLLHVTYWKHAPGAALRSGVIVDPAFEGWQQIRVKSPLEELEQQR
jgi:hypothetical protein